MLGNLLPMLLGFVSIDMAAPLSCAWIVSTPNTVHQHEEERSHSYEWKTQSRDLSSILLPGDVADCKRE